MDERDPPSLESRMMLAQLGQKRAYPFLRLLRWVLRVSAGLVCAVGLLLSILLLSGGVSQEQRSIIEGFGGPEKGSGVFAAMLLFASTAVRAALLLAVSEGIQLLLDLRATQVETSAPRSS